jgi:sugar lactone lactonase YvrE
MVDPSGVIHTTAGIGAQFYTPGLGEMSSVGPPGLLIGDGGPAMLARLQGAVSLALDRCGSLYVADSGNNRVRRIEPKGRIVTVAGGVMRGYSGDGGRATDASLFRPHGVAIGGSGDLYIADTENARIRKVIAPVPGLTGTGTGTTDPCSI